MPFQGGGPALIDVLGGHNKIMFSSLVQAVPHIKTGRLRALGTGGKERVPALADVPTISEAGVPGYEALNWWGTARAGRHAAPIIERLHKALERGAGHAGDPGAVRQGRRRDPQDELGGVRQVHRERDEQVGARGEGGRDQGGVSAPRHASRGAPRRAEHGRMSRLDRSFAVDESERRCNSNPNKDVWAGVMLIVTGAASVIIARNYAFGTSLRMGPGYFPSVLGGMLVLFGLYLVASGLRSNEKIEGNWSLRALIMLPLSLVLFGLLMEYAGFVPALMVLIFGSARGRQRIQARRGAAAGGRPHRASRSRCSSTGLGLPYPLFAAW